VGARACSGPTSSRPTGRGLAARSAAKMAAGQRSVRIASGLIAAVCSPEVSPEICANPGKGKENR
jgi:hypothetical protein